ncbi:MAG: zinc-dependent metalloprotease [Phycisphaeraceae bacterium]|nr:zinc-dependent metalloprotease [Phycisphaeraceae bacterium]
MPESTVGRKVRLGLLIAAVGGLMGISTTLGQSDPTNTEPTGADQLTPAEMARMMGGRSGGGSRDQDFADWSDVSEGFTQVVSTADGDSYYNIWTRSKDGQMLAELPRGFDRKRQFIATTMGGGDVYAGLQVSDLYCYWRRFDKTMALMAPQISVTSTGDAETGSSVQRLFTDRVILSVPIVCMGPNGQPVIDMDDFLLGNASQFFGGSGMGLQTRLATIAEAKAFPSNVELAWEVPARDGTLQTFHFSLSEIRGNPSYRPREADTRVGYFTTTHLDLGKMNSEETWVRYINRWHLEKRDPSLRLSPPKEPIVYYIDHATPVRYRRWVKQGLDYWNKAFEQVGILGAIDIQYQDAETGAHMDKDPEDVRYNFIRWLANNQGTAIGPSRVNPETGQILDADIVLTDGFIRGFYFQYHDMMPELAMENFSPETLAWFDSHPRWDPRIRLADPAERDEMIAARLAQGPRAYGGHPATMVDATVAGDDLYDGLGARHSQMNGMCMASHGKAMQMERLRMQLEMLDGHLAIPDDDTVLDGPDDIPAEVLEMIRKQLEQNPELIHQIPDEIKAKLGMGQAKPPAAEQQPERRRRGNRPAPEGEGGEGGDEPTSLLDGIPEEFLGPMLADLVAHEVGHTLGLRHNFRASSIQTLDEMNSEEFAGKKTWGASVMDYNGDNIRVANGTVQGDVSMTNIGPYDFWAIEYGYTFGDPKEIVKRVAEEDLPYATDEDTWGPDPYAARWDLGKDVINYARENIRLADWHRQRILDRFVKDGQSWSRARRAYSMTLSLQTRSLSMMSRWLGGTYVYRDKKGDPNGRAPIEIVEPTKQREALQFIIDNSFYDEAFGLTPELFQYLANDRWYDEGGMAAIFDSPSWPVHDRIMGIQASALSMVMNPGTLGRVYDNELMTPTGQDAVTVSEVMDSVYGSVFSELDGSADRRYSARDPMISSLRRNLQREMVERLIDLSLEGGSSSAASKPIATLATMKLRNLSDKLGRVTSNGNAGKLDPYTLAHLTESKIRIDKALEAQYIYNMPNMAAISAPRGRQFGTEQPGR